MATTPTTSTKFDAKAALRNIPNKPGVYRMLDEKGVVIYVGKAKELKKRVSSYFLKNVSSPKTRVMVTHIRDIDFLSCPQFFSEHYLMAGDIIQN